MNTQAIAAINAEILRQEKELKKLRELVRMPNAEHFADAHNAAVRHLRVIAAQAKQGG